MDARDNPSAVNLKLKKEMSKLRISGPFDTSPVQNFAWFPLGLVPKKEPGQFRLIHDLSDPKFTSVTYQNIESVVELVQFYGSKCQMAKCDIQDAFFLLTMHKDDHHLLGFSLAKSILLFSCFTHGCFFHFIMSTVQIIFFSVMLHFKL
jgi:hypothetical protein